MSDRLISYCRRYPPTIATDNGFIATRIYPRIDAENHWCGEFIHRDSEDRLVEILRRRDIAPLHRKLRE
jgi:hypothetical protein